MLNQLSCHSSSIGPQCFWTVSFVPNGMDKETFLLQGRVQWLFRRINMMFEVFLVMVFTSQDLRLVPPSFVEPYGVVEECVEEANKRNYGKIYNNLEGPGEKYFFCMKAVFPS